MRKTNWKRWLLASFVCALLVFSMSFIALGDSGADSTLTTGTVFEVVYHPGTEDEVVVLYDISKYEDTEEDEENGIDAACGALAYEIGRAHV